MTHIPSILFNIYDYTKAKYIDTVGYEALIIGNYRLIDKVIVPEKRN